MESAIQLEWQLELRQKCHQPGGFSTRSELENKHPDLSSLPLPVLPTLAAASGGQTLVESREEGAPRCLSASSAQRKMEKERHPVGPKTLTPNPADRSYLTYRGIF